MMRGKGIMAAIAMVFAVSAFAANYTWTGGGMPTDDGTYLWNDSANWGGGGYPSAGDIAEFQDIGCTIVIPDDGVTVMRVYAVSGEWRLTGGQITISDAAPFCSAIGTYDHRGSAVFIFDCPVNFSSTADKTILSGNIFNNMVTLGTPGRAFFMRGDANGTTGLTVFSGPRTYAFGNNNNICSGKNDGNTAHGGDMFILDGAVVNAKIFFDFAGSVTTVSNATLTTSASGTSQSIDMTHDSILNVLDGGTVSCAGRLTVGQSNSVGGDPTVNVRNATLNANYMRTYSSGKPQIYLDGGEINVTGNFDFNSGAVGTGLHIGKGKLTVGGTMTQGGSQYIYFTVPDDQQLGTIEVGTMKHTTAENTVQINIYDATLANGTVYTLVTDKSQTLTIADYTVLYNGAPAATKGALAVNDGVLTFRPNATAVVWTGGGDGSKFSDPANWNGGVIPFVGSSVYFLTEAGGTLVNDLEGLDLERIQFGSDAGAFVIGGNAITMSGLVMNRSANEQVLNCEIAAAEGQELMTDFSLASVVFAGGATGVALTGQNDLSRVLKGHFTFTRTQPEGNTDNDYWETVTYIVTSGSTLSVPGEMFVRNGYGNPTFVIEEGAVMNVGTYKCRAAFETFDVKGTLNVGTMWGYGFTPVFTTATSTGTVNVEQVVVSANNASQMRAARFNIGAGGIAGRLSGMFANGDVRGVLWADGITVRATADWSIYNETNLPNVKLDVAGAVTLDTDGHTVSFEIPVTGAGSLALTAGSILDVTGIDNCVPLIPAAGATIRTPPLPRAIALTAPESGVVTIELVAPASGLPNNSSFELFTGTGLEAGDLGKFAVSVVGFPETTGVLSLDEDSLIFTVTSGGMDADTLLWRPTNETGTVWSSAVEAWLTAQTSTRTGFIEFSNVRFDAAETFYNTKVEIEDDIYVGNITINSDRDYTFAGPGKFSGAGKLVKSGLGALTMNGPALTSQDIDIVGGKLVIGVDAPASALGSGTNGVVRISAGGQLDLNYTLDASNDATRNSITSDKIYHIAGTGPDGAGAIVNNGGSTTWYRALARVFLDDDASLGGDARIDFRPGVLDTSPPFIFGPEMTLTDNIIPTGGNYGMHLNNAIVTLGKLAVSENARLGMEGTITANIQDGIELANGSGVDFYNGTINAADGATASFCVADGATVAFKNNNGTSNVNVPVTVPFESTLNLAAGEIAYGDTLENAGTVNVSGGTQIFKGALSGSGEWKTSAGIARIETADFNDGLTWELTAGVEGLRFWKGSQLADKRINVTGVSGASVILGNYETENPTLGSLTVVGPGVALMYAADVVLPRIDVTGSGTCRSYTDNLETRIRFTDGTWECGTFFVGGSSRGSHFFSYEGTVISADYFHIGNGSYLAPRALYELEGGIFEIGSNGMASAYSPLGTFACFNNGTLSAKSDFEAKWGFPGLFGRRDGDALTIDIGNHEVTYRSGLGGKGTVNVTGSGSFYTTKPYTNSDLFQNLAEGKWTVGAVGMNDLSGASGFAGGLEVESNCFARVCIRSDELCEFANYGTNDWHSFTGHNNAAWNLVNNFNHLHLKLVSTDKVYNAHTFVYRGQFYVAESEAGVWTFAGTYDDRIAFEVDGTLVFETAASGEIKYGNIELTAGWHDFYITTYDNTGTQGPTGWSGCGLGFAPRALTSTTLADYTKFNFGTIPIRPANSVQWERRPNVAAADWKTWEDFDTLTVTNTLQQLNGYNTWPEAANALNRLSGSFFVEAADAGDWQFWSSYDDNISLSIDGVDSGMDGRRDSVQTATVVYSLTEGWHTFEIRVTDRGGNCGPWDDASPYAIGVQITPVGGEAREMVAFDERRFRFVRTGKPPLAGIGGTLTLQSGSILENGAGEPSICPIWGTIEGSGQLRGRFAFQNAVWRITGNARELDGVVSFAASSAGILTNPETLAKLGGIELRFSERPARVKYEICDALGLTVETAAELPVTASYEGQGESVCEFKAAVENGKLVLLNLNPAGTLLFLR